VIVSHFGQRPMPMISDPDGAAGIIAEATLA
jgi:hypothetical protein